MPYVWVVVHVPLLLDWIVQILVARPMGSVVMIVPLMMMMMMMIGQGFPSSHRHLRGFGIVLFLDWDDEDDDQKE
jgi:hypothetical protein